MTHNLLWLVALVCYATIILSLIGTGVWALLILPGLLKILGLLPLGVLAFFVYLCIVD